MINLKLEILLLKNKLLVLPNNKSNNLDLPLEISSTGMLSIDYVGEGTELNFEKLINLELIILILRVQNYIYVHYQIKI